MNYLRDRLDYDTTVKYAFEVDRPTLLERLAGGKRVREFLNVEIPTVLKRIADLLVRLDDGELLHLDFQSTHDPRMAHRAGVIGLLFDQKLGPGLALRQVVLYIGHDKMSMPASVRVGGIAVDYQLIDIREFDAAELIATGNPGDLALALLARNGPAHLRQILRAAKRLRGAARQRVLVELTVFSGLRRAENRLTMEMKSMEITLDIEKHPILRDILHQGMAKGQAQGRAQGRVEMLASILRGRFGELPAWAHDRLNKATPAQFDRFSQRALTATTLEQVFGKK